YLALLESILTTRSTDPGRTLETLGCWVGFGPISTAVLQVHAKRARSRDDVCAMKNELRRAALFAAGTARVGTGIWGVVPARARGRVAIFVAKFLRQSVDDHLLVIAGHLAELHHHFHGATGVEHLDRAGHDARSALGALVVEEHVGNARILFRDGK